MTDKPEKPTPKQEIVYSKEQFLASTQFDLQDKDILSGILDADQQYSLAAAKQKLEEFKGGQA